MIATSTGQAWAVTSVTSAHSADKAKRTARKAEQSKPIDWLARFGLTCRGVVWLLVGCLALDLAVGGRDRADRTGALSVIKDQPFGGALLLALAAGFTGYAGWRLLQAAVGHRYVEEGRKRWAKRGASLFRGLLYAGLAYSTLHFLLSSSGGDKTRPVTARVMAHSGGALLVRLVGAGLIVGGLVMAVRGLKQDFDEKLKPVPSSMRTPVQVVGTVGLVGRGLVFALIGGFLVAAAWTYDPSKAQGLDGALKSVAHEPFGQLLLGAAAIGLIAFGFWSFAEARWRKI